MILFLKTHVSGYTKKDGTVVVPHEDRRAAAKPNSATPNKVLNDETKDSIAEWIRDFIDNNKEGGVFGLRVIPSGFEVKAGDDLPDSFAWDFENDVSSDESKGGVSTIGIEDYPEIDEIISSINLTEGYDGNQIVLVHGPTVAGGDVEEGDPGEIVIADPVVVRAWGVGKGNEKFYSAKSASAENLSKSHPITQAATRSTAAPNLNDGDIRRNPGEPSPRQAKSDRYKKPLLKWNGLRIRVENPAGSVRRGQDRAGKTWETRMVYDYGYVERSEGVDGDEVDVYVGPNPDAPLVYVVHQRRYGDWDAYDEDKAMLGFDSCDDACAAYLKHYDDPRFLGPVTAMPVAEFCAKVLATRKEPAMIKAARELGDFGEGPRVLFLKAHVKAHTRRLPSGKVITVDPYDTKVQKRGDGTGQMDMFAAADEHGEVPPGKVLFTRKPGEKKPNKEDAMKEFSSSPRKRNKAPSEPPPADGDENARTLLERGGAAEKVASAYFRAHSRGPITIDQTNELRRFYSGPEGMKVLEKIAADHGDDSIGDLMDRVISVALGGSGESSEQKKYYVTMLRDGHKQPAYLAGPFDNHDDALSHVDSARDKAQEIDPRATFDSFGTTGVTAEKHPPGVLNEHLGIGGGSKPVQPRISNISIETLNRRKKDFPHMGSASGWSIHYDGGLPGEDPEFVLLRKVKRANEAGGGYVSGRIVSGFPTEAAAKEWAKSNKEQSLLGTDRSQS